MCILVVNTQSLETRAHNKYNLNLETVYGRSTNINRKDVFL